MRTLSAAQLKEAGKAKATQSKVIASRPAPEMVPSAPPEWEFTIERGGNNLIRTITAHAK